jgi:thymidylate kinase
MMTDQDKIELLAAVDAYVANPVGTIGVDTVIEEAIKRIHERRDNERTT